MPKRLINSLKTRGFRATWQLAKSKLGQQQKTSTNKAKALASDFRPLHLSTTKQPVVSVIIPVYNHYRHTYHCLRSIADITDQTPFEVIVVDDCSTDDTRQLIKDVAGIRYHRQAQNGGFIRSCNQGAQLAQGDYLLFLNNDTEVRDHWLDSLVETFAQHSHVGLVGSQLRYPDGRLQEAGGIVFSDASGWNYGRLESPDQPEVNHVRAVSYCSGASIMVPTALFKKLGCFDERYVPAYYEDTDLAFAVRASGLRVLYQPHSRVIHFEGISSGTDVSSGVKKYQVINQQKFADKWKDALRHQPAPGSAIELARFQESKPRILIVDACTPTPDQDSGSLRMINMIQILMELNYHVSFMPENMAYFGDYTAQLQNLGVECVYAPKYSSPVDYLENKGRYFEVVILSRYYVAQPLLKALKDYAPKARLWFDTVDLHYLREQRMAELAADKSALKVAGHTKSKELAVAKACDLTLVVSPYEQAVLGREMPELNVAVLSNIHEIYGCHKNYRQRRDIVFIGGYQHTPNVDGICWFVSDIWPKIQAELPDAVLHIVGSKAPDKVKELGQKAGIEFHGFVEDIAPMMTNIRIAVAPLRFGAGVKGKVNMSMSYGQPVVGTTVAVEGMFTRHGEDVLMADDAEEFAREVIRLYQDEELWNRLSKGGLDNVRHYFSFEAAKNVLAGLLQVPAE
ncbi:glycosyltransferase [Marinicella pacifica]